MRLRNLLDDDSAVSPVIGVILMVAITVILAAVIASFVLGLGPGGSVAPTADFSFNYDSGASPQQVTVTHAGGDSIRYDELFIRGENLDLSDGETDVNSDGQWHIDDTSGSVEGTSAVVSGDSADVVVDDDSYVLRVVWQDVNGDSSSELKVDRGPGAS